MGGSSPLLASGGVAATGVPTTGAYTWEGVQLLGAAGDLANLTPGRFTLTTTFSGAATAAFSYTGGTTTAADGTLTANGNITRATGALESLASGFSLSGVAATAITEGRFFGRLSGAGASAVSGLFVTTNASGDRYAGGFVGGAPQIVFSTHAFTGTGEEGGFGEAFVTLNADATNSRLVFVSNDLDALKAEANVASDSARAASLLDAIVTTGGSPTTTTTLRVTGSAGGSYSYKSGTAGLDRYVAGANDVTLLVVDGSAQSGESVIAHLAKPHTGAFSNGAYTWQGVQLSAARAELHDTTSGAFQITVTFSNAATANFTYTTIGASRPFTLSGSGTITKSTGGLAATALSFDADGAGATSSTQTARLQGTFGGADGESLVGLFATTSGTTGYAGGFVGTGKQDVHTILDETTDHVGLGYVADRNIGAGTANGLVLVGDDYDALLATTRGAVDATRDASIVANIAPTGLSAAGPAAIGVDHPQAFANERTGGSIGFGAGGTSYTVTAWEDGSGTADLLFLNGTGVSSSGSFFIAGGDARPASSVLAGSYSWEGVLVYAGKSLHTNQQTSGFRLTANFANAGNGTFTGTSASGDITAGVTVDSGTGRISLRGNLQVAGSVAGGEISGFVSGDAAEAVSGVFTTGSGTTIAGGFVGGAPRVGRDIARPAGAGTGGFKFGEAARDVFGAAHGTGDIIFLGNDYETRRDAINVTSDTTRAAQLLSNLGAALTGGTFKDNINRYTLSSSNNLQYGSSSFEQGAVFEDGSRSARLFALRSGNDGFFVSGGGNLSGSISGTFEYEGTFVSATQGAFDALREGTFALTATFVSGGTGSFTFAGSTSAAGAQTSRLVVTSGGTLISATGRLTASVATYIQGDGSAKTHDARIEGSIHGVGGVAVAGLFTTTETSGTNHAGGFAGSVLEFATQILTGFGGRPAPASEGFARSGMIVLPVIGGGLTRLFTPDLDNSLGDANNSVAATRQGAYLRQFAKSIAGSDIAAGTVSGNLVKNREVTGYTYPDSSTAIPAKLTQDWLGLAGILAADATNVSGASANRAGSLLITGGAALTGSLSGQYTWTGVQLVGESNTLKTLTEEAVQVTASFTNSGAQTFTVATQGGSKTNDLTGTGSVDVATGALGGTGLSLAVGGVSQTVSFAGSLHGAFGASLSGVFANSEAIAGKYYAGAIIASGALDLPIIAGGPHGTRTTSAPAIARGTYNVNGHGAAQSALFLVPQGSGALFEANHASATIRSNALAANLGTIGGTAADFDVPDRAAGDLDLAIRTRSAPVSHGGATSSVTVYEDRGGDASLLAAGGLGPLLASGGVAATNVPATGAYTWEGVQLLGDADDLAGLTPGRFTLTTTFSGAATAAFIYTGGTTTAANGTLTASGNITRATGALESSAAGFSLAGVEASAITEGKLFGRLSGVGASAVSGLFVTTNTGGDRYAGGFVGGAPQIVFSTHAFTGAGDEGGFGEAFVTLDAQATTSRVAFVSNDLGALATEANVASDTARAASLFDAIVTTGGSTTTTTKLRVTGNIGGSYAYRSGTAGLDQYVAGASDARLFVIDGSGQSGESVIAHVVKPHTGSIANGAHTWQGVHLFARRDDLDNTTQGTFQITASFGAAATAGFAYTTIGASQSFTLSGSGTITKSTGRFASTALSFDADGTGTASSTQTARLQGAFGGADAQSLVGLFATTSGASGHAGGFIGTGKQDVHTILDQTGDHVGLGYVADRNLGTGAANGLVLVGDDYDALLATTRGAVDATRGASIVASIAPTGLSAADQVAIGAGHPQAFANEKTGGSIAFGGANYTVTAWEDKDGVADLLFLNGTGVSNSGSLLVAGGDSRPAAGVLTGSYSWEGILVYSGKSLHTGQRKSGFRLTADFASAGAGTFTGTSASGDITAGVTIDAGTGRISRRGDLRVAGGAAGGEISGFVSGASAQAVSGVFTTGSGTTIAGGFVGGAPRVARDIARPAGAGTGGLTIGEAARDVFAAAHDTGNIIFLGDAYATRRDAVNVASDTTRAAQLLSNLGATLSGGTLENNVNKYTLAASPSTNRIQYGSSSFEQGSVFEDGGRTARLFALRDGAAGFFVAGGRNLSGPVSGRFEYEGVFVSATQGALGTLREGTFSLIANFAAGGSGSFTFAGTTSAAGARTSRLEVTSGGTIAAATGRLTAASASYTQGAAATKTHDARIEGGIFGVGGVAVAGVFTTTATSGGNHAGGFAGSVLEFATQILADFEGRPAPASEGFAQSDRIVLPVIGGGLTNLFTPDLANILADANSSVEATRLGAYLRQFASLDAAGTITAGAVSGNVIKDRQVTGYTYPDSGTAVPAKLTHDWLGIAGILTANATNVSGANASRAGSLLITGGAAFTGSLSGQYTWTGVQLVGESNALETLTEEAVQVTANFTNSGTQTFTVATQGSGKTNDLTGSGTVDVATGALGGTGVSLEVGGVGQSVRFSGRLHGADGASLSGVFANSDAIGGKYYAGAIVASGAINLAIIAGGPHGTDVTSTPAIARGLYNVNGHGAAQNALFLVPQGSGALFVANHASANIRNNALATNLGTIGGTAADFDVPNRAANDLDLAVRTRSATVSHGGATPSVTVYEDRGGSASLLAAGGSGPLLASGGVAATGVPTTGAYTWEGVQLLGAAGDLANLTPGRFTLTTTFSGAATAAFIYTGGTTTAADGTLTASGNITRASGALESLASGFSLAGVAGAAITEGRFFGRLSGAGVSAVSGLFVTTNTGGTRYAGGFVGGAPQILFPTHELTGTGEEGGFGEAFVTLDAEAANSRVVFVANDLGALETEANVPSDSARAGSLLDAIVTTGNFPTTTTTLRIAVGEGGDYAYRSGTAGLDRYGRRCERRNPSGCRRVRAVRRVGYRPCRKAAHRRLCERRAHLAGRASLCAAGRSRQHNAGHVPDHREFQRRRHTSFTYSTIGASPAIHPVGQRHHHQEHGTVCLDHAVV